MSGKLVAVRLDGLWSLGGPATIVAYPASVAEYLRLATDRDGARNPLMRLWSLEKGSDAPIGSRVLLIEPFPQ